MPRRIPLYPGYAPLASEHEGFLDFFGAHHRNRMPVVLCDGSSVKWPADWPVKAAREWRSGSGTFLHPEARRTPARGRIGTPRS
jgi:hypothetical protein